LNVAQKVLTAFLNEVLFRCVVATPFENMIEGHYTRFAKGRSVVERLVRHCDVLSLRNATLTYVAVLLLAVGFRRFVIGKANAPWVTIDEY
jgi:hypothetical protein